MRKSKQVIILRKDLNMRKGKMISQGAHASMKVILDMMSKQMVPTTFYGTSGDEVEMRCITLKDDTPIKDWINGLFTKITCSVDSEKELLELYEKAESMKIPCALITDSGLTEFGGIPTNTAIAIGPEWEDIINSITGHLKLL